jgi:hypothetical protein
MTRLASLLSRRKQQPENRIKERERRKAEKIQKKIRDRKPNEKKNPKQQ